MKEKEKLLLFQDKCIILVIVCELDYSYVSDVDGDKVQGVCERRVDGVG